MVTAALRDFKRSSLREYVFPGTDAAVVFMPEGTRPAQEIQEVLDRSYQQRWFPIQGGARAKVPFHYAEGREQRERQQDRTDRAPTPGLERPEGRSPSHG